MLNIQILSEVQKYSDAFLTKMRARAILVQEEIKKYVQLQHHHHIIIGPDQNHI
jgi:hypothetical protein